MKLVKVILNFRKAYIPWVSVLLPRATYDLSATPHGRPYDVVTQLREILARKSSLPEVHPGQGMTIWVPTHAPQPLVIALGISQPSSRTMHVDYP